MEYKELYTKIDKDLIMRMVDEHQDEHLHLEFKTIQKTDMGRDDRKNLAKALSGFGNSSGGLIIWGINAKEGENGVDCAQYLELIEDIDLFLSKLNEHTGVAVDPIVDGVEHKAIKFDTGKGICITIVPEAITGPHMAKLGEDRYYKRSGDSFYKMEHYDISDMFGRRRVPKLEVYYSVSISDEHGFAGKLQDFRFTINIGVKNIGKGTSSSTYIATKKIRTLDFVTSNVDIYEIESSISNDWFKCCCNKDIVLHPNTQMDFIRIHSKRITIDELRDLKIKFEVTAENIQMSSGCLTINEDEIIELVNY
jgi:hypothetical protein